MTYQVVNECLEHEGKFYKLIKVAGGDIIWQPTTERPSAEIEEASVDEEAPKRRGRTRKIDDAT
jgi:hypothetical protein